MSKVPLVPSAPISEFGDFDPSELTDGRLQGQGRDGSYVPGFSEMRVARDTALGQLARGEISQSDVAPLPVNLRWARAQDKSGKPDSSKQFSHGRRGYRLVTKADLKSDWLKDTPGGAQWDAAGNLRNGDLTLMVCDAKSAARNSYSQRQETEARVTGVTNAFEQNMAGQSTYKGADLVVEKLPASTSKGK